MLLLKYYVQYHTYSFSLEFDLDDSFRGLQCGGVFRKPRPILILLTIGVKKNL